MATIAPKAESLKLNLGSNSFPTLSAIVQCTLAGGPPLSLVLFFDGASRRGCPILAVCARVGFLTFRSMMTMVTTERK